MKTYNPKSSAHGTTIQKAQENYFSFMGGTCCVDTQPELCDLERNIEECEAMLNNAICRTDKTEINFWRRMLQAAKVQRREILAA